MLFNFSNAIHLFNWIIQFAKCIYLITIPAIQRKELQDSTVTHVRAPFLRGPSHWHNCKSNSPIFIERNMDLQINYANFNEKKEWSFNIQQSYLFKFQKEIEDLKNSKIVLQFKFGEKMIKYFKTCFYFIRIMRGTLKRLNLEKFS